jgi:hypothetical protein
MFVKKLVLAIVVLALGPLSFAGALRVNAHPSDTAAALRAKTAAAEIVAHSSESTTCAFTFPDARKGLINFCVTANGNIAQLEIPTSIPMVSQANHAEGYGICDDSTNVAYSDFGGLGDSGNWGASTVLSHTANSVKIARTTKDALWTLTQTITRTSGALTSAKVSMALTNNSGTSRTAILIRYADVDAAGVAGNNLDATQNSAMAWNSGAFLDPGNAFGMVLQNLSTGHFLSLGFVQSTAAPPNPCNPLANVAPALLTDTDGSLMMFYEVTVRSHATMTLNAAYKAR